MAAYGTFRVTDKKCATCNYYQGARRFGMQANKPYYVYAAAGTTPCLANPKRIVTANSRKLEGRFAKGGMRCPACGSANMLLIRIWTKTKGVVYEWGGNLSARAAPATYCPAVSLSPVYRQLTLAI